MERKFNFVKSLKNDYGLLLAFLFFIMPIFILCYFIFLEKSINLPALFCLSFSEMIKTSDFLLLLIFGLLLLISLFCFIKRIFYIKSFEKEEKRIPGKVVDIHYIKDRCGVDVEFQVDRTVCKKHFSLMNNAQTKYIHMDSEIVLLMKGDDAKKVLIEELYFD